MFARHVSMYLKPDSVAGFTCTKENKIIPLLRKQKGFKYAIAFVVPNGTEAAGNSVWDHGCGVRLPHLTGQRKSAERVK